MTEHIVEASMPLSPQSPGAIMRTARENAGVHLAVLSVNLKVSIKQLEALEADQFDYLPEPVFARALAAKVCRFLKIDSDPVLALMPQMTNGLKPLQLIDPKNESGPQSNRSRLSSKGLAFGGPKWPQPGPWAMSAGVYKLVTVLSVIGMAVILFIAIAPPNERVLYVVAGFIALALILWVVVENRRFEGPPTGERIAARKAAIAAAERAVGEKG